MNKPEVAIMIEGQNGLTWPRWQRLVQAVEEFGFGGLFRSDHFTNANPPDKDSLELWVSLTWLAANTSRLEFGPLVTPFSFRHPALTARMATAVDDLSQGRLTLGLGAGWQEREHQMFGFDLSNRSNRFDRFEEGLEAITGLLHSDSPVTFEGQYFQLHEAVLLPRPQRPSGPRILIGGTGLKRTLPLAARFADEWNATFLPSADFARLNAHLDDLLAREGRSPESVTRSMMTGCVFAKDDVGLQKKLDARGRSKAELRQRGMIVGSRSEVKGQLDELSRSGVQKVMLQWLDLDDLDGLEALAKLIL